MSRCSVRSSILTNEWKLIRRQMMTNFMIVTIVIIGQISNRIWLVVKLNKERQKGFLNNTDKGYVCSIDVISMESGIGVLSSNSSQEAVVFTFTQITLERYEPFSSSPW